jgi:integrase
MSFKLLRESRRLFTPDEYAWLFIERAFGLRREEMETSLRSEKTHVIRGQTLYVYQPKLERTVLRPNDRWKKIPAVLPEQREALALIRAGKFTCPRSLRGLRDSAGRKLTWNCGRKDFYPAMVAAGYDRATVSVWLGHRDLSTARQYYDDPLDQSPFAAEDDDAA